MTQILHHESDIAKLCPRWSACSVNNCPLDPRFPNLPTNPDDKEKICPMEKNVRLRCSSKFPGALKLNGLTSREWGAMQKESSLTAAQKTERSERMKSYAFKSARSQTG